MDEDGLSPAIRRDKAKALGSASKNFTGPVFEAMSCSPSFTKQFCARANCQDAMKSMTNVCKKVF